MPSPTVNDPLGERDDPLDFAQQLTKLVDERIKHGVRYRTTTKFNDTSDAELALELLARGWAVYMPRGNKA